MAATLPGCGSGPSRQVREALVTVDLRNSPGLRRYARVRTRYRCLNRPEFDAFLFEQLPLPTTLVQIEDPAGLLAKLRVGREDPGAVVHGPITSAQSHRQAVTPQICSNDPARDRLQRES